MRLKTRICIVTTASLITCCLVLWSLNYASTSHLMSDIKELECVDVDQEKSYAKLTAIEDKEDKNNTRLWISLLLVITFGGGASFWAVSRTVKPIKKLSTKIRDFHTSDLKNPIPLPKSKDESYELISSYNIMIDRLNMAFEREKRITANIAHEFKTPLSVLMTSCDVLEMKENPTIEDYERVIKITKEKAEYLSQITTSLLSLHRQTHTLHNEECNISSLISSIVEDLQPVASEKNITINTDCSDVDINCDRLIFAQMINNFIENGIKYNKEGGTVSITEKADSDGTLFITIKDTGMGIPDNAKELVFEPFFRVDKSRNKEYGGVGLGMAFSKVVADLYRGTIKISDNEPQGTVIDLSFPNIIIGK